MLLKVTLPDPDPTGLSLSWPFPAQGTAFQPAPGVPRTTAEGCSLNIVC